MSEIRAVRGYMSSFVVHYDNRGDETMVTYLLAGTKGPSPYVGIN